MVAQNQILAFIFDQGDKELPWEECCVSIVEKSKLHARMLNITIEDIDGNEVEIRVTPEDAVSYGNWLITMGKQMQGEH
jgi:peptide deformylase